MNFFAFFKNEKKPVHDPVPTKPVPAPVVRDPNDWYAINPVSPKHTYKEDIHSVVDAFNYLCWRTKGMGADVRKWAVDEIDNFIKNETIDLRHLPGLVCTDCVHLIQYGTASDKTPFVCIRLNSLNAIDPSFVEIRKDEIRKFLKKSALEFMAQMDKGNAGSYVLDNQKINVYRILTHGHFCRRIDPRSVMYLTNVEKDPAYAVRKEANISLIDSISEAIADDINNARRIFTHKDTIIAKHGNEMFIVWWNGSLISKRMVDEFDEDNRIHQCNMQCDKMVMEKIGIAEEMKRDLDRSGISYVSSTFGLEFYGI